MENQTLVESTKAALANAIRKGSELLPIEKDKSKVKRFNKALKETNIYKKGKP